MIKGQTFFSIQIQVRTRLLSHPTTNLHLIMNSAMRLILFAAFLFHTIAASTDQKQNLWEIISTDDRLKTLALALQATDLDDAAEQPGSTTLFAPSDEAFAKVPQDVVTRLSDPANKNELAELLAYHAVGEKALTSADILAMDLPLRLQTLSGDYITITKQGSQVKVNDATVTTADIVASNGVIHIINSVLMPEQSSN